MPPVYEDKDYYVLSWGKKKVYRPGEGMVDSFGWVKSDFMSHERAYALMIQHLNNGVSAYTYGR